MATTTTLIDISITAVLPNPGGDNYLGSSAADTFIGGMGIDTIDGQGGNDVLNGNIGADIVRGGSGDDTVFGGKGDDSVYGDLGDDRISGDRGNDNLFGGSGADKFVFGVGYGADWVGDFSFDQGDRILLAPGTTFTLITFQGQVQLNLGNGDIIGLIGVGTFNEDYITYG